MICPADTAARGSYLFSRLMFLCLQFVRWHRIALSVKGDSVTLIRDCDEQFTDALDRTSVPDMRNAILLLGRDASNGT